MKRINYRKLAFEHYPPVCAHCGFGIADVLEVCHIDCQRTNNDISNLVILCPTCHKMHDLDLIATETICMMRDRPKVVRWAKRMKDAGVKAALSRRSREFGAPSKAATGSAQGCCNSCSKQKQESAHGLGLCHSFRSTLAAPTIAPPRP